MQILQFHQQIKELEIETLRKVADLAEKLQDKEKKIRDKSKVINELTIKRKEMEFLIEKTSISLFLKGRYKENNNRLVELFQENKDIEERLIALDQELDKIEKPELLNEAKKIAEQKEKELKQIEVDQILWLKPTIFGLGIDLNNIIKKFKRLRK